MLNFLVSFSTTLLQVFFDLPTSLLPSISSSITFLSMLFCKIIDGTLQNRLYVAVAFADVVPLLMIMQLKCKYCLYKHIWNKDDAYPLMNLTFMKPLITFIALKHLATPTASKMYNLDTLKGAYRGVPWHRSRERKITNHRSQAFYLFYKIIFKVFGNWMCHKSSEIQIGRASCRERV